MMGAPNSLDLNCKVRVMKEAPIDATQELAKFHWSLQYEKESNKSI